MLTTRKVEDCSGKQAEQEEAERDGGAGWWLMARESRPEVFLTSCPPLRVVCLTGEQTP